MKVLIEKKEVKLIPETDEEKKLLDLFRTDMGELRTGHIYQSDSESAEYLTIYRSGFGQLEYW